MKNNILEKLEAFLETEEGKESIRKFGEKLKKERIFEERWVNRLINTLQNKTDEELSILFWAFDKHQEKRRDILYSQYVDGQTSLYNPLLKVFERLGIEALEDAYGMFSSAIFDWRGYRMESYCGQGCFYSLTKL
jgi:hypothetical protein